MHIVHVFAQVRPDQIEAFRQATVINAHASCTAEAGVARFDVLQQQDDPTRFCLVEVYRTEEDAALHKQTTHYQTWRDTVAPMMASPRSSMKYVNVYPEDPHWRPAARPVREIQPAKRPKSKDVSRIRP